MAAECVKYINLLKVLLVFFPKPFIIVSTIHFIFITFATLQNVSFYSTIAFECKCFWVYVTFKMNLTNAGNAIMLKKA